MRLLVSVVLVTVALLFAAPSALAAPDAEMDIVESLFQDRPTATTQADASQASPRVPSIAGNEPISTLVAHEPEDDAPQPAAKQDPDASTSLTDTIWGAAAADPDMAAHVGSLTAADHETEDSGATINAVPEPSAILLAVAALVYFLLFGRRRRVM